MRPVPVVVLFFFWSFFAATSAYSQSVKFSLSAGAQYGPYAMDDLREYRNFFEQVSPFRPMLKATYDFPARPAFEVAAIVQPGRWHVGIIAWRVSTGARTDYEDYSGFYRFDMIATMNAIGLRVNYDVAKLSEGKVFFASVQLAAGFNAVTLREQFNIADSKGKTSMKFESRNWIAMPGVGYRHAISSHFNASLESRYHLDINPKGLTFKSSNEPLRLPGREDLQVNWKGFRAALNLTYVF